MYFHLYTCIIYIYQDTEMNREIHIFSSGFLIFLAINFIFFEFQGLVQQFEIS